MTSALRQSVGIVSRIVEKETGQPPESIAMLASFDRGAAILSNALREGGKPIPHKLLFDEAATFRSSRFLAFLIEPKTSTNHMIDLAKALELLSLVLRGAKGTVGALKRAKDLQLWAQQTRAGKVPTKARLYRQLASLLSDLQTNAFSGDPRKDWTLLRGMLRGMGVAEIFGSLTGTSNI